MLKKSLLAALCAGTLATGLSAGELHTDWITPVTGTTEATLGASVRAVEADEASDTTKVTIAIPRANMEGADDMQEVVVVGKRPDDSEEPLEIRHEWVKDYDKDNYGLVLYLGKDGNIPLRLYLKSPD